MVLVQDLADYTTGTLRGQWFTPTDYADAPEFADAVASFLAIAPGHEEYSIDDHEELPGAYVPRHMALNDLWTLCANVVEYGPAFAHWAGNVGAVDAVEDFQDRYRGLWDTPREYAQEFADEIGGLVPMAWPYDCIDWEQATRELMMDYATFDATEGVYLFFTN